LVDSFVQQKTRETEASNSLPEPTGSLDSTLRAKTNLSRVTGESAVAARSGKGMRYTPKIKNTAEVYGNKCFIRPPAGLRNQSLLHRLRSIKTVEQSPANLALKFS
jgi:hypothetical protein